jgi:hypothetical protein
MENHLRIVIPRVRRRALGGIVGKTFKLLTVLDERRVKHGLGKSRFEVLARCQCGVEKWFEERNLRRGSTTSCGSCANKTHGGSKTPEYAVWRSMVDRCKLPTHQAYANYGGRGITVCERWSKYENFLADMGQQPFKGASIDRINNNEGYSPTNCRWANVLEQNRNRRTNRLITVGNETLPVSVWSARSGIRHNTITYRLDNGWAAQDAVTVIPNLANRKSGAGKSYGER